VEKLPRVVWSHNTTASRTIGFTLFKLLYGEEAMPLEEARHQSLRIIKQALAEKRLLQGNNRRHKIGSSRKCYNIPRPNQKVERQPSD